MIRIRKGRETDRNFILKSWLESYRSYGPAPLVTSAIYYKEHQAIIKQLLDTIPVYIVCTDDEDQIMGFRVGGDTVHFIYIKEVFRKNKLANMLLDESPATQFSQFTKFAFLFQRRKLQYNPYEFYKGQINEDRNHETRPSTTGSLV